MFDSNLMVKNKKAKVFGIISVKGGVGKSSVAVNLAGTLAQKDKKVLVVDLDPQGNASSVLDFKFQTEDGNLLYLLSHYISGGVEVIKKGKSLNEVAQALSDQLRTLITPTKFENLFLVGAASGSPQSYNYFDKTEANGELLYVLDTYINILSEEFDYVVLDCPPNYAFMTSLGMVASDYIMVVVKPDGFANTSYFSSIEWIKGVYKEIDGEANILGTVINMYHATNRHETEAIYVIKKAAEVMDIKVFDGIIPNSAHLSNAIHTKDLVVYKNDRRSLGVRNSFELIVNEIFNTINKGERR